jgi:two-component sensor histidine kinase
LRFLNLTSFLFAVAALPGHAQNACQCPEEQQRRPDLMRYFGTGQVDSALMIFEAIRKVGTPECRIAYCNAMAQYYFNKNRISDIKPLMEEERRILDSIACGKQAYSRHFSTFGNYYLSVNQYEKAAACFIEALANADDNPLAQYRSAMSVSVVFAQMEQPEKTLDYLRQAEGAAQRLSGGSEKGNAKSNSPDLLSEVFSRKASAFVSLFDKKTDPAYLDSIAFLARKSLALSLQTQNRHIVISAYGNLANHARYARRYAEGLAYVDSMLRFVPEAQRDRYYYQAYGLKSQLYQGLNEGQRAVVFADSALAAARRFNPQMMVNALEHLYELHKKLKRHEQALAAYEQYAALRDSFASVDKFNIINELEQQYNKVKNEKSISGLQQERRIILLRNRLLGLGVLLAALAIAVLVFLQRQRAALAKQKELEIEQRLNRARMNPHFFFNALGALQSLALKNGSGPGTALQISKFAAIMRQTLESTYTEYVTLEQEKTYLEQYLEVQKMRFPDRFSYQVWVASDLDEDRALTPPMLVQPFVENAIEHGFSDHSADNHLSIRFLKQNGELVLEIEDNGKGLSDVPARKEKHHARATQIVRDRLEILSRREKSRARFEVENKSGNGVLARIFLPLRIKEV